MSKPPVSRSQQSVDTLYKRISDVLADACGRACRAVNFAIVQAYYEIGWIIVEEEQQGKAKTDYGKQLIEKLSRCLTKDLDRSNLWHIRSFL